MNERSKALLLLVWIEQKREYCPEQTSNKSSFKCLQAIWARSWVRNPFGTDDYFHILICQPFKIKKELFLQPPFRSFLSFNFFSAGDKKCFGPIFFRSQNIETKQNETKRNIGHRRCWTDIVVSRTATTIFFWSYWTNDWLYADYKEIYAQTCKVDIKAPFLFLPSMDLYDTFD